MLQKGNEKQFGLLSYAQAFVGLFTAFATLRLDGIVVRELVKDESRREELIGTAFWLKLMGAIVVLLIKSERIEHRVLELIQKYNVKKYFFLDSSFPMIYFLSKNGEKNIALRFSEFEGIDTILNMAGKVEWVWVDCFTKLPIDQKNYTILKNHGFKLCLVSPELQGQSDKLNDYKQYLSSQKITFDAICTKSYNIDMWSK